MSSPLARFERKSRAESSKMPINADTLSTNALPSPNSSVLTKLTSGKEPRNLLTSKNL